MDKFQVKPSRLFYLLGILVGLVGIAFFGYFLFTSITGIAVSTPQLTAPGEYEIEFDDPGNYTIFYEPRTIFEGKAYSTLTSNLDKLDISLIHSQTGTKVAISPAKVDSNFSIQGRHGVGYWEFKLDKPGIYDFSAQYKGKGGPEVVFSFSKDFMGNLFRVIINGLAIFAATSILSGLIILFTYLKRKKALNQIDQQNKPKEPPPASDKIVPKPLTEGEKWDPDKANNQPLPQPPLPPQAVEIYEEKPLLAELLTWKGRLNRYRYMKNSGILLLGWFLYILAFMYLGGNLQGQVGAIVSFASTIFAWLLFMTLVVFNGIKRLHDLNMTGWWSFGMLVPFLNLFLAILMLFFKGTEGSNKFGPDPLK